MAKIYVVNFITGFIFMYSLPPANTSIEDLNKISPNSKKSSDKNSPTPQELKSIAEEINRAQRVRNVEGLNITNDTLLLAVQVHDRIHYLKDFVLSLRSVEGISSTVLIFSHDFYLETANALVEAVDFAPVLQIFYPFSTQFYPAVYFENQKIMNGNNSESLDYFEELSQPKLHWWWKINTIFDHLNITKYFCGYVLFLEEDFFLAPDTIFVLRMMIELAKVYRDINLFSLGKGQEYSTYDPEQYRKNVDKAEIESLKHTLAFAINRKVFQEMVSCSEVFCTYNDYNWDWSLRYVSQNCLCKKLTSLTLQSPRVFHIGDCGMHHSDRDCSRKTLLNKALSTLDSVRFSLFPKRLKVNRVIFREQPFPNWGGFTNPLDIGLCLNMSSSVLNSSSCMKGDFQRGAQGNKPRDALVNHGSETKKYVDDLESSDGTKLMTESIFVWFILIHIFVHTLFLRDKHASY